MGERFYPVESSPGSLREYRGVLWGTAALVALNVTLALPTGAAKVPVLQEATAIERPLSGKDGKLIEAGEGSDDVMTELAAAPVASKELSKLRGGFRTHSGLEISVGFDFKTFLNGQLRVHNIFNVAGSSPNNSHHGASAGSSTPHVIQTSVPIQVATTVVPAIGDAVNQVNNAVGGAQAPSGDAAAATTIVPSVEPIVINEITSGKITVVNEIAPGTVVTNTIQGGKINTIVQNVADGVTIDQITSLSVGITTPTDFVSSVRSGRRIGIGVDVSNVMRSALLGAIAR